MSTSEYRPVDIQNVVDPPTFARPTRRDFLTRLGGGVVVFVTFGGLATAQEAARPAAGAARPSLPTDFNAFLRIGEDGRVTCFTGKIEMGQGPITSLPQMLADELEVPLDSVDIIMGDTDLCPWTWAHSAR